MTEVNVTPPVVSGTLRQGQVLTTTNGTWTFDLDHLEFAYQWLRCDVDGANCVDIPGANSVSYLLGAADVGSRIRSEVTATEVAADPSPGTVDPPLPPTTYSIPGGATSVTTSAGLIAAMTGAAKDIVIENGVYDNATPFVNSGGHRLYARNVGGALFHAGISFGAGSGSGGGLVRGVNFDMNNLNKGQDGSCVYIWGAGGVNTKVYDCKFEGNYVMRYGIRALQNQGLDCRRLELRHFTDVGLRASDNVRVAYGASTSHINTITDIFADGISRNPPGSSNGVAEAAVWVGHPVDNPVARLDLRDVGRKALETVNSCYDTTFTDFAIDQRGSHAQAGGIGVGVYLEHNNHYNTYENFYIIGVNRGFNGEWNEGTPGNAGAQHCTIRNGTVDATGWTGGGHTAGVYLDEGCDSNTVTGNTFLNQNWAGVGAWKNVGTNVFDPNDYSGMLPGALPLRTTYFFA